jgi:hypothetical protein
MCEPVHTWLTSDAENMSSNTNTGEHLFQIGKCHVPDCSLLLHPNYYQSYGTAIVRSTATLRNLAFIPCQQRMRFWNSWGRLDHQQACGRVENRGGKPENRNRQEYDARGRLQRLCEAHRQGDESFKMRRPRRSASAVWATGASIGLWPNMAPTRGAIAQLLFLFIHSLSGRPSGAYRSQKPSEFDGHRGNADRAIDGGEAGVARRTPF